MFSKNNHWHEPLYIKHSKLLGIHTRHMRTITECHMMTYPKGYTHQAILTTTLLIESSNKRSDNLYIAHIDLSKAYNRVHQNKLWNKLHEEGITGKLWNAVRSTYSDIKEQVQVCAHTLKGNTTYKMV